MITFLIIVIAVLFLLLVIACYKLYKAKKYNAYIFKEWNKLYLEKEGIK